MSETASSSALASATATSTASASAKATASVLPPKPSAVTSQMESSSVSSTLGVTYTVRPTCSLQPFANTDKGVLTPFAYAGMGAGATALAGFAVWGAMRYFFHAQTSKLPLSANVFSGSDRYAGLNDGSSYRASEGRPLLLGRALQELSQFSDRDVGER